MKKKKQKDKYSVVYISASALLIGVLLFAGVRALQIYIPQSNDSHNFEKLKKEVGLDDVKAEDIIGNSALANDNNDSESVFVPDGKITALADMNGDFVGWLNIEDTVIDYPVMKSAENDPEFYLHRDFYKRYSYSGTLFIGEGCGVDSDVFVIYGHNMNAGTMFGSLDSYRSAVFAGEHKDIVLRTLSGNRVYRVFAAFQTKIYSEPTDAFEYYRAVGELDREKYDETAENIRNMSLISLNEAPEYPQQIMLLSTCAYHTDEGRFVVAAYRIA